MAGVRNMVAQAEEEGERTGAAATMRRTVLTLPNALTLARSVAAVTAALLFAAADREALATILCAAASATDGLDGWYARRFRKLTRIGAFFDPIADKLVMTVVYGVMAVETRSRLVWCLFLIVLARDLAVTAARWRRLRESGNAPPPDRWGKRKMFVQATAGVGLLGYAFVLQGEWNVPWIVVAIVFGISAFLSCYSGSRYLTGGLLGSRSRAPVPRA